MARYLGVDGGGSKTAFALIDDDGPRPGPRHRADLLLLRRWLRRRRTCSAARRHGHLRAGRHRPSDIDAAFFGIPGYGEASGDIARLDAVPGRVLGHDRYSCDNDMVCGWAGSLAAEDGINVISGTGSMTYGERWAPGTGSAAGASCSATRVGVLGRDAGAERVQPDERRQAGPRSAVRAPQGAAAASRATSTSSAWSSTRWGGNRSSIAALATTVCDAARRGDETATRRSCRGRRRTRRRWSKPPGAVGFTEQDTVPVSYSGGMFSDDGFLALFLAALQTAAGELRPAAPRCSIRRSAPPCTPPSTADDPLPPTPSTSSPASDHDRRGDHDHDRRCHRDHQQLDLLRRAARPVLGCVGRLLRLPATCTAIPTR